MRAATSLSNRPVHGNRHWETLRVEHAVLNLGKAIDLAGMLLSMVRPDMVRPDIFRRVSDIYYI